MRLDRAKPVYFMEVGFASIEQDETSSNGLFSFVGLNDGDYELVVEKDGEIIDSRIVVVEQGKVSPIIVDLSNVTKHVEFFDPMMPDRVISDVEVSFFDGSTTHTLDKDNQTKLKINKGPDLSLVEFATANEINRTLLSRNKGLQKIPFTNSNQLLALAKKQGFDVKDGIIFGFIDSQELYKVQLAENPAEKVIYFNSEFNPVDPDSGSVRGFVIAGFSEGLNTLVITSIEDGAILGTDLVYSDHESISLSHLEILPFR